MTLTVATETPLQDDVRALVAELNAELLADTPAEHCHHLTVEQMADAATTVLVARDGGAAVACGALKRHGDGLGEIKRMYTRPAWRGRGAAGRVLAELERIAREEGLERLVLETSHAARAAWRVYERGGFTRCGRFLDYPESDFSVFYEKRLAP